MNSQGQFVTLPVADGTSMRAYVSKPSGNTHHAGVLLFQEAFGVNHHIRNVADRLAKEGYIVISPELFHRTAGDGFEVAYTDFPKIQEHYTAITMDTLKNDIDASYHWLSSQNEGMKISSIGFCLGGRVSFIANSMLPLVAGISYYGGGIQNLTHLAEKLHAPHLFFWGGLDKHILPETIEQVTASLRTAGKPFSNVVISYADHGFHCDERPSYNKFAAKESWAMTLAFLKNRCDVQLRVIP